MAKNPWTLKNGVYTLLEATTENREKLADHLSGIIKEKGSSALKDFTFQFGEASKPYRLSQTSIKNLLSKKTERVEFRSTTGNLNRGQAKVRPGKIVKEGSKYAGDIKKMTKDFTKLVKGIEGHTPKKLQKYFAENNELLRKITNQVAVENQKLLDKGFTKEDLQRISQGHDQRLSLSVDSPRNLFIELLEENRAKGNRYSPNPKSSLAIGNPIKEGLDPLENWKRDYVLWLDKPENGGSGILPQRGDYSSLLEQRFRAIGDDRWESLTDEQKIKATADVDDLITDSEKLNQWLPSEAAERQKWGLLTPDQAAQSGELLSDGGMRSPDTRTTKQIQSFDEKLANQFGSQDVSPASKRLSRMPGFDQDIDAGLTASDQMTQFKKIGRLNRLTKMAGALDKAGAATLFAQNPLAGTIAMGMQTPFFQRQMGKALTKFGVRMIPGVSFGTGALAAAGYMINGQWTKAGIQLLAGAIGEIPGGAGDLTQSAIELGLEGHDFYKEKVNKPKVDPNIDPNVKPKVRSWGSLNKINTRTFNPATYL